MFLACEAVPETLAGRAAIDVLLGDVDEVLLAKTAVRFRA